MHIGYHPNLTSINTLSFNVSFGSGNMLVFRVHLSSTQYKHSIHIQQVAFVRMHHNR